LLEKKNRIVIVRRIASGKVRGKLGGVSAGRDKNEVCLSAAGEKSICFEVIENGRFGTDANRE
jgi:hypothetical protein